MRWSELTGGAVQTTDVGPLSPDIFIILGAKERTAVFPECATGEAEMLCRLQELPGFNNEALIEAMACTDNKTFIGWKERPKQPASDDAQKRRA